MFSLSQSDSNLGDTLGRVWGCELTIYFLSNFAVDVRGARQAIDAATTAELQLILPIIVISLRQQRGDAAASRVLAYMRSIWPWTWEY